MQRMNRVIFIFMEGGNHNPITLKPWGTDSMTVLTSGRDMFNVSLHKTDDGVDELAPLVQEQGHLLWYH